MSIRITWDNPEKTIIRHIYEGSWTLEEYYKLIDQNYQMIDEVQHGVYIINDLRKMTGMPKDLAMAIRYAANKAHPSEIINVFVGASTFVSLLVEAINKTIKGGATEVNYADTLEEAYAFIENHKSSHAAS